MRFVRHDDYHARSECGRYTIGTEPGLYLAWRSRSHPQGVLLISHHHYPRDDRQARIDALRAAERACREDSGQSTGDTNGKLF